MGCFLSLRSAAYCFWPEVKTVHGPAFMSRSRGFCQEYSGCCSRNGAAKKSSPQGWPARATKLILAAIALSVAFPCTAPPGSYGSHPHSFTPRGEVSAWPHNPRSLVRSFFSKLSTWSERNASARLTSTFPFAWLISSSHRTCRAFGDEDLSFGSKVVSSLMSFGSRAKFELTK